MAQIYLISKIKRIIIFQSYSRAIWLEKNSTWYYLNNEGRMLTGWQEINGKDYFLDYSSGEMRTGLINDSDGKLYHLDEDSGAVKKGWMKKEDGTWYYFGGDDGESITGWINDNDSII